MISSHFQFHRPASIEEAVSLLAAAGPHARVIGGGTSLIPALSSGLEDPTVVLDLYLLSLDRVVETGREVRIGATTTYAALTASAVIRSRLPLLADMIRQVTGGPGLWNLATLGGSACYANPASDGPGCLAALDAIFRLVSVEGHRLVKAADFFVGAFQTERKPCEMLTEIIIPFQDPSTRCTYLKVKSSASSWPIVCLSCLFVGDDDDKRIRLSLGGATATPFVLEWPCLDSLDHDIIRDLACEFANGLGMEWSDELAGPGYRRAIVPALAERALHAVAGGSL